MCALRAQLQECHDDVLTLSEIYRYTIYSHGASREQDLGNQSDSDRTSLFDSDSTSSSDSDSTSSSEGSDDEDLLADIQARKEAANKIKIWLHKLRELKKQKDRLAKQKAEEVAAGLKAALEEEERKLNRQEKVIFDELHRLSARQAVDREKQRNERLRQEKETQEAKEREIQRQRKEFEEKQKKLLAEVAEREKKGKEQEAARQAAERKSIIQFKAQELSLIQMINDFFTYMSQNKRSPQMFDMSMTTARMVQQNFKFPANVEKDKQFSEMLQDNFRKKGTEQFFWILMYTYWYIDMTQRMDEMLFDFIWKMCGLIGDDEFDSIMLNALAHAHNEHSKEYGAWNKLCVQVCKNIDLENPEHVQKMARLFFHDNKYNSAVMPFLQSWYEQVNFQDFVNPAYTHYYMQRTQVIKYSDQLSKPDINFDQLVMRVQLTLIDKLKLWSTNEIEKLMYNLLIILGVKTFPSEDKLMNSVTASIMQKLQSIETLMILPPDV